MMSVRSLALISFSLSMIIERSQSDVYVYDQSNKELHDYDDQSAGFGPALPSAGLKGLLVTTTPANGCKPVAPAPNFSIPGYRWIALIPRTKGNSSCDFDLKVQNAQNANFSAVIIYNYEDQLITMGPHERDIHIPSSMVTVSDGKALIARYLSNTTSGNSTPTYYLKLVAEKPFNIGAYFIPFAVSILVLFLGLIIFTLIKCHLQRRRTNLHRLPRSALKQLKTKKFVKGDRWEVCAICLDDYVDGAKLRILPCDHAYHMKCIDPWLLNNRRQCPVCKRYVFPNQEHSDEEQPNRASSEQTPLLRPINEQPPESRDARQRSLREQRLVNRVPNISFATNESSESDEDASADNQSLTTAPPTDRLFSQPGRYRHRPLPRRSGVHESSNTTFITPVPANFFVGSLSGTTDNTNPSARSLVDDLSDIETIDDEEMHSVLASSESNPTYVNDEPSQL